MLHSGTTPSRGADYQTSMGRPVLILLASLLAVLVLGAGLVRVEKDPSVDAFVPADHPAALARDEARAVFGLEDPLIVGLAAPAGESAFTPAMLEAVRAIGEALRALPNVDKDGIISIATESAVFGEDGDLRVEPILEDGPATDATAALARRRLAMMPMMEGLLASEAGDLLAIVVPVFDPNDATGTYAAVRRIAEEGAPAGATAHVAGVAAMNGRLAEMVDHDTKIFIPAAIAVVFAVLFAALRRLRALVGPLFVVAGSAAAAVGVLGWSGAKYYLITTALPVVVLAIAVADSLHLVAFYLRARAASPALDARAAAAQALGKTFLPITLTSVTTIAGFAGLALGSQMRPIAEFGIFAAVGVAAAWALSLLALPAILVLTDLKPRPGAASEPKAAVLDRAVEAVTRASLARPLAAGGALAAALALFALFAVEARFDYARKNYFLAGEPVRESDTVLNARLAGLNFLDVTVAAPESGGLMTPNALAAIRTLKDRVAALPGVERAVAIDDYMAVMHAALTGEAGLPAAARAPAQYMFLYEASGDPGDFDEEIDYDHRRALVRAQMRTDRFSETRPTVLALERLAAEWSAETGLAAAVSGRVAVNDGWMSLLADSHFRGLAIAVGLVFVASAAAFRAPGPALLALLPVLTGVLFVYAAMGLFRIDIAPATSMTAAIAAGLGVDFGVHLISHVRAARRSGASLREATSGSYVTVARACFYSAAALAVALAVVCLSSAPPLRWFGALVAAAALGSLAGALFIIPAALAILERFRRDTPMPA